MRPYRPLALALVCSLAGGLAAAPALCARKIIISTDIGDDIDDAFALVFALNSPELEVDAVIASYGHPPSKARLIQKLLHIAGRDAIPVLVGKYVEKHDSRQLQWAADWKPKNLVGDGPRALARRITRSNEKTTLVPYGPLTDIAEMLRIAPEVKAHIDEIILMGGSAYRGWNVNDPPCPEYNIMADAKAAQTVFGSGLPIVMVGLDVTTMMKLQDAEMERIRNSPSPLPKALYVLYKAWGRPVPTMYDPVALAVAFQRDLVKMDRLCVEVADHGLTRILPGGKPNASVCVDVDKQRFMDLFMERILK